MPKVCICQICTCGRHHCPRKHTKDTIPKDGTAANFSTEMRRAYPPKECDRPRLRKPMQQLGIPTGSMAKTSIAMQDYTAKKIPPKFVRQKTKYKPPDSQMYFKTTYRNDYEKFKLGQKATLIKHGENLVIPSEKMECRTTQNRDFLAWDRKTADACRGKPIIPSGGTLTDRGKEFIGQSETMRSYKNPPPTTRVKGKKKLDHLFSEGKFEGVATTNVDYQPKKLQPRECCKPKKSAMHWPEGPIKGYTTYKTDYKPPSGWCKAKPCGPKESQLKPEHGPFTGNSCYKTDYPAHKTLTRSTPSWVPKNKYEKSDAPFSGDTTYRKAYVCPPEDLIPEKGKPLRCNLTVGSEAMSKVTTHQLDYAYPEGFKPSLSTKTDNVYVPPTKPMASETTMRHDYTDKHAIRSKPVKYPGNLGLSGDRMDLLTMSRKDYQCHKIDCPAARLKMGDEEVLSEYKFLESTRDHEYYQKIKPKKRNT